MSWTKPEGNVSFYRVQLTDGKIVQKENVTVTSKNMTGLSAGTMYNVNVTTLADDGMTEGESETVSLYTSKYIFDCGLPNNG